MKKIQLHTAKLDRHGVRRDAGEVLVMGNGETADVTTDEASEWLKAKHAVEYSEPKIGGDD